ncbi:MAG: stage II sporulation protein M [Planctomycetota bacterium]
MDQASRRSEEEARLDRLAELVRRAEGIGGIGTSGMSERDLIELPRLYRFAASEIARRETAGAGAAGESVERARTLVARAHAVLHRDLDRERQGIVARVLRFFADEVPRAIRGEWKVISTAFAIVYGLALLSYFVVRHDLDYAWSLLSNEMVSQEIAQLEATAQGEPFRGNFTFGLGQSPHLAGWIMAHNMSVGVLFFGAGLVPPLFLLALAVNGLMLGTYTAVAAHWGQAGAISSILWCHGVIEIQALVLAGAGGLVLVRAWIAPGPWSRGHAMALESRQAWKLLAPVFPMLFVSGIIEGFVSPHAGFAVRVSVAVGTGLAILAWVLLGGRTPTGEAARYGGV